MITSRLKKKHFLQVLKKVLKKYILHITKSVKLQHTLIKRFKLYRKKQ